MLDPSGRLQQVLRLQRQKDGCQTPSDLIGFGVLVFADTLVHSFFLELRDQLGQSAQIPISSLFKYDLQDQFDLNLTFPQTLGPQRIN